MNNGANRLPLARRWVGLARVGRQWAQAARRWARGAMDLLLPGVCPGCQSAQAAAEGLCEACNRRLLELVSMSYCPRCGASVGPGLPISEEGCLLCPNPLGRFGRVVRLGPYTEPLRGILRQLKYHRDESMTRRLAGMLAQAVRTGCEGRRLDLVAPVPMHWRRRLARGLDHSRLLAGSIARELGLPVGDELARVRATAQQAHLSRRRRIENVRGAFAARPADTLAGAGVLLVDDITTTGATASEAAAALLKAGASHVTLAVVAKSEPARAHADYWNA